MEFEMRVCPHCGADFYPNVWNQKFCCDAHKVAAENHRWYERHKSQRILDAQIRRQLRRLPDEFSSPDVQRMFGRSPTFVEDYLHGRKEPVLNAHKDASGRWHIRRSDLIAWLKAMEKLHKIINWRA